MIRTPRMTVAQLKEHTDKQFGAVQKQLSAHDRRFDSLDAKLESMGAKLDAFIKYVHGALELPTRVVDDHEKRLQDLESWRREST